MSARGAREPIHQKERGEGNRSLSAAEGHHTRARVSPTTQHERFAFSCVTATQEKKTASLRTMQPMRAFRTHGDMAQGNKPPETVKTLREVLDALRDPFVTPPGRGSLEEARALTEQISAQITWLMDHKDQHMYGRERILGKGLPDASADPAFHANHLPPPIEQQHHFDERDVVRPLATPVLQDNPFERTVSFQHTSEIFHTDAQRSRRRAMRKESESSLGSGLHGGLTSSVSSPGLLNSSSIYHYKDAKIPIVLPGKMHWVRDTHRRIGLPNAVVNQTSLEKMGLPSLPSELFFGSYDNQHVQVQSQAYGSDREGKGAMPTFDSHYAHWTEKRRVEAENRHLNHAKRFSFDRISQNGVMG